MSSYLTNALRSSNLTSFCRQSFRKTLDYNLPSYIIIPSRNTFILKRKYPTRLIKKGETDRRFKGKDYVYELVEDTELKKHPSVPVILKRNVDGVGLKGECVHLKKSVAYNEFLLTGLADYATPEAIEAAKTRKATKLQEDFSSPYAPLTVKYLENLVLSVVMNKDMDWTLEPWHLRVAFRKAGVHVPEECIQLPNRPINGPNLDLESKIFCVTVTINNKEKATVRCRLHHWSTDLTNRLPYIKQFWNHPLEPIFPEDADLIKSLPVIKYKSDSIET